MAYMYSRLMIHMFDLSSCILDWKWERERGRERERERERWQSLRCVWFKRKNEEWKKIMQSNEKTWTNINLKVSSHSKYEFKSEIKKYTLSMLFYTISL
jgi:hypothetical protein